MVELCSGKPLLQLDYLPTGFLENRSLLGQLLPQLPHFCLGRGTLASQQSGFTPGSFP